MPTNINFQMAKIDSHRPKNWLPETKKLLLGMQNADAQNWILGTKNRLQEAQNRLQVAKI